MGSCCSSNESRDYNRRVRQPEHLHEQQIQNPRQQNGNIIQDVNEQYKIYFEILDQQFSGKGLKKTQAYKSNIDIGQIEKLRNIFWETRVEGKQEVWVILRSIISEDEETAKFLVDEAELKPIRDSLQHVYDKLGQKYDIPVFCINDPIEYSLQKFEERGLAQSTSNEEIKLFIRSSLLNGKDLEIRSKLNQLVLEIKDSINIELQTKLQIACKSIKLLYKGKELLDNYQLGRYNLVNESIVIAMFKVE